MLAWLVLLPHLDPLWNVSLGISGFKRQNKFKYEYGLVFVVASSDNCCKPSTTVDGLTAGVVWSTVVSRVRCSEPVGLSRRPLCWRRHSRTISFHSACSMILLCLCLCGSRSKTNKVFDLLIGWFIDLLIYNSIKWTSLTWSLTSYPAFSFAYISYYVDQSVSSVSVASALQFAPHFLHAYSTFHSQSAVPFSLQWCS